MRKRKTIGPIEKRVRKAWASTANRKITPAIRAIKALCPALSDGLMTLWCKKSDAISRSPQVWAVKFAAWKALDIDFAKQADERKGKKGAK